MREESMTKITDSGEALATTEPTPMITEEAVEGVMTEAIMDDVKSDESPEDIDATEGVSKLGTGDAEDDTEDYPKDEHLTDEDYLSDDDSAAAEHLPDEDYLEEDSLSDKDVGEDYESDLYQLKADFPALGNLESIEELESPSEYLRFRTLGLTPKEALLATGQRPPSPTPPRPTSPIAAKPGGQRIPSHYLKMAREIFVNLSDREIQALYKRVK